MPPPLSPQDNLTMSDAERITYFALTDSRGKHTPFGIKKKDRDRHTYVIGKTGMGKSTLLENMAVQDIQRGEGLCFIDPHGSTAEKLMEYIPEERVKDVLYYAPFDLQYPISFNVLENVDADKRHFVVAGLMSTFEKIWVDAWSARMAYILQNTLAALLEFPGATLLGVNRMYIDKEYRKNVIAKITDPSVRSFWVDEYSKYTDRYTQEATPAIQNKIGQFAANALVRNIIGQERSAFDMRELMDQKKIFIVNLSKGRVGEGNTNLLGSMLITKLYLAAMSRADASPSLLRQLPYFYLYVDEFQNFANKSFADILSESRKYKLALTIAHQYVEQMEEEVASAVFGNVGTMMAFRVGAYDAEVLEKEFAPTFMMEDLVNLGARQIYLKLMIDGISSQPFSAVTMPPIPEPTVSYKDMAVAYSRATYARPRAEVEKNISDWVGKKYDDPEAEEKERARLERRAERDANGTSIPPTPTPTVSNSSRPAYGRPSQNDRPFRPPENRPAPQQSYRNDRTGDAQERPAVRSETPRPFRPAPRAEPMAPTTQTGPRVYRQTEDRFPRHEPSPQAPRPAPRVPAPQPTQTDLRDILSRLSKQAAPSTQAPQEKGEAPVQPARTPLQPVVPRPVIPTPRAAEGQTPQVQQTPRPPASLPHDNGKSITADGRESLKALLDKVAAAKPQQGGAQQVAENKQASSTSGQASVAATPYDTPKTKQPEVSDQELRALLHVEKPSL